MPMTRVLALFSLLCLLPANANAQACSSGDSTAIAGTSASATDLLVSTVWQDVMNVAWFEIAVFDEHDVQIASELVWPIPGQLTQTTFDEILDDLPASGFQFSAVVRDSAGQEVSQRHPFRMIVRCPRATGPCAWTTQDGVYTDALAISEPLRDVLDALKTVGSSDLLSDALAKRPELRGPVLTLAAQVDRLDQQLGLGSECVCAWQHSSGRAPKSRTCGKYGPGKLPSGWGWEQLTELGPGASARAAGQALDWKTLPIDSSVGEVWQTLELTCWKIQEWTLDPQPTALVPDLRLPKLATCVDSCRGDIESSAKLRYQLSARTLEPPAGSGPSAVARATVQGYLTRDDWTHQTSANHDWDACRRYPPANGCTSPGSGDIQLPAEGVFTDEGTRRVTTTFEGKATVDLAAGIDDAWSYGRSCFERAVIRSTGYAACAVQLSSEAELRPASITIDCGELQIEPWG